MAGPNWKLEDDLKTVTVTFPTNPPVALVFDASGVDNLLLHLGDFRASMTPKFQSAFAVGQKVSVVPDPAWTTEPDLMQGHSLLHLGDPRYGWLHYLLPPHEAEKLGRLLQMQAASLPQSPPPNKAN